MAAMSELAPMDIAGRLPRLVALLEGAGCDALLVTTLTNVRYLCGFSGSAAMLLVAPGRVTFVSDGRYATQAAEELGAAGVVGEIEIGRQARQREVLCAAAAGLGRLGLESASVTWAQQRSMAAEWFTGCELVPTEDLVEGMRMVKDDGEVARIEAASAIADAALAVVLPMLADTPTEAEFGLALDFEMRRRGASDVSFETIVASGPNGAKPHARPEHRPIGPGELVVLDFGALLDGYHSDMTRTVCVGEPRAAEHRRMLEAVGAAQAAGVAAVRDGVGTAKVDAVCREVITDYGWGDAFVHSTGHGVGLDIHEAPTLSPTSEGMLAVGHVVTVEPGVYLPALGGVRIEDTVVVGPDGCRPLTHSPKDLIVA